MNGVLKGMLFVLMLVYVLSPVDVCPGPIDDVIVILIYMASNKSLKAIDD
jgi:hypothetical protein